MLQHSSRLAANTPIKYPNRNRAALCYQGNKETLKKQVHRHQQSLPVNTNGNQCKTENGARTN